MLNFYDFEVWRKLWCVTIINPLTNEETVIVNDPKKLAYHYAKHKNEIYIGFNNRQYDDYIFKAILSGFEPWEMNDWIINKDRKGWEFSTLLRKVKLNSFDCMIGFNGLKTLEAFMGSDIRETTIPFDYEGEFTKSMIDEVLFYNRHDVMETIKTFMQRKSEFDSYMGLVKLFNLPLSYLSKSKAQLAAIITGAKKTKHKDEFDVSIPPTLRIEKYTQVVDYFQRDWNYDNNFEIEIAGVPHVYGTGGIHGAIPNYFGEGEFLHVDVNSYYPSLVIRYPEYCMTRTGASLQKFTDIYNQRLAYKAQGNPMADALKIVINSFYGAMKDKMNPLYDPRCANNICIFGQLLLTDLIERLEGHCDLIQSNTDGLIIKLHNNEEEVRAICKEWEERTGMGLGYDKVFKIAQKDVNNYIMTMEKRGKVKIEAKGAYVKDLNDLDYDLAIVNEAVRAYLLEGIPVERTINSCNDLRKFQKVVKLSNKYKWVEHEQTRTGTVKYDNKAYRVFASSDHSDGRLLKCKEAEIVTYQDHRWEYAMRMGFPIKTDEQGEYIEHYPSGNGYDPYSPPTKVYKIECVNDKVKKDKFANTPDHCFIDNGNIVGKQVPSNLDKQWYIDLARKRVEDFTT